VVGLKWKDALQNGSLVLLKEIRGGIGGGLLCQDPQNLSPFDFLSPVSDDFLPWICFHHSLFF
jgi:hypothetical protein